MEKIQSLIEDAALSGVGHDWDVKDLQRRVGNELMREEVDDIETEFESTIPIYTNEIVDELEKGDTDK